MYRRIGLLPKTGRATSRRWFCLSSSLVGLRGLESLMPEEAYQNPGFKWGYGAEEEEGAVIGARGADR